MNRARFAPTAMQHSLIGQHNACQKFQLARRICKPVHSARVHQQRLITPCRSLENEQRDPSPTQSKEERSASPPTVEQEQGSFGKLAAGGAVALGVAAFLFTRLSAGEVTLGTLERNSLPLEVALSNQRPTMVEFYADWCSVCKRLTPEVYQAEQEFKNEVNFVMLNIENPKWAPEVAEYRVGGVPHFVFLDERGQLQAAAVGKLPLQVLEGNLSALATRKTLPFRGKRGPVSTVAGTESSPPQNAGPRSHS